MTLDARLARLEQQGQPAEEPFRFCFITAEGLTRDTLNGETWTADEFHRLHPDVRSFTFSIQRAHAGDEELTP